MDFDFHGQTKPIALYVIHADGTKQTKHVELTNFLCRNMNFKRLSRNPALLQMLYLDAAKENTQAFDSVYLVSLNADVKRAMTRGVWVVCLSPTHEEDAPMRAESQSDSHGAEGTKQLKSKKQKDADFQCKRLSFAPVVLRLKSETENTAIALISTFLK